TIRLQAPPLRLRQLQISLSPGVGNAVNGDFGMEFGLSGPAISEFKVFEMTEVDQPPGVAFDALLVYPKSMARSGESGSVIVLFVVDENGIPRDAVVQESSHRAFEKPAMDAALRSKFRSGIKGGRNVAVRVMRRYQFKSPR
ncbi:energy transducer TonB, partial [Verrucomicrobia bacterium]|nr:energy transducer TonB [Verrucomicrobiota bacterium]